MRINLSTLGGQLVASKVVKSLDEINAFVNMMMEAVDCVLIPTVEYL